MLGAVRLHVATYLVACRRETGMGVLPDPVRPAPREMAPVTARRCRGELVGRGEQPPTWSRSASGAATGAGHLHVCSDAGARRGFVAWLRLVFPSLVSAVLRGGVSRVPLRQ